MTKQDSWIVAFVLTVIAALMLVPAAASDHFVAAMFAVMALLAGVFGWSEVAHALLPGESPRTGPVEDWMWVGRERRIGLARYDGGSRLTLPLFDRWRGGWAVRIPPTRLCLCTYRRGRRPSR